MQKLARITKQKTAFTFLEVIIVIVLLSLFTFLIVGGIKAANNKNSDETEFAFKILSRDKYYGQTLTVYLDVNTNQKYLVAQIGSGIAITPLIPKKD